MDAVDRRILSCLLQDGRASYADVGDEVGLSASAVKRRVDRLRADGSVRGFTAVIDPTALGWATEAYVQVYCKGTVSPHELRRSLEAVPEVVGACTISGAPDALIHLLAADITQLEQALERIRDQHNIDHTETVIVLSRLIDRSRP
jgi:DNA-binding Lrp family transcriptional regulator